MKPALSMFSILISNFIDNATDAEIDGVVEYLKNCVYYISNPDEMVDSSG